MTTNNECFVCRQSKKKQRSSIMCTGCSQRFCQPHHMEHGQSIEKDFNLLLQEHNTLRQNLFNDNGDSNNSRLNLFKKIDTWEKDMINNIQKIAVSTKAHVTQILSEKKDQLKMKFTLTANELKDSQTGNDYVETDVQEWQKQLNDCKQEFEKLLVSNTNFIDITIQSLDLENSIRIKRIDDIRIRTRMEKSPKIGTHENNRGMNIIRTLDSSNSRVQSRHSDRQFKWRKSKPKDESDSSQSVEVDEDGGCFHGDCKVLMADGSTKLAKDIRRGDLLRTPNGSEASVTYVVMIPCTNSTASMVNFDSGLNITPWHPVRINGDWKFPRDICRVKAIQCREMYNFVLEKDHICIINGFECVTLGHDFQGEVIGHSYYGTANVVEDLCAMDKSNTGFIELPPKSTIRDNKTKLVIGIRRSTSITC